MELRWNYVVFGEELGVSGGKWGEKEAGPGWKSQKEQLLLVRIG